jgi:nicotinate-nucleotide pyrophosphorylase (carboxylating)
MPDRTIPPDPSRLSRAVELALDEDGARSDITTRAVVDPHQQAAAAVVAKGEGVLAGVPVAEAVFRALDKPITFDALIADGDRITSGVVCARVSGRLASILSGERVALNFLQQLSGVATATRRVVDKVSDLPVRILDTRKTTPGLRELERYAVRVGGGHNHRFNLSAAMLIKDNHLAAAKLRGLDIARVLALAQSETRAGTHIIIEVATPGEALEALEAGARWLLLDNMSCTDLRAVVEKARTYAGVTLEASGGITIENVRAIAETGVDVISIGALTHSAPAIDLSLEVEFD